MSAHLETILRLASSMPHGKDGKFVSPRGASARGSKAGMQQRQIARFLQRGKSGASYDRSVAQQARNSAKQPNAEALRANFKNRVNYEQKPFMGGTFGTKGAAAAAKKGREAAAATSGPNNTFRQPTVASARAAARADDKKYPMPKSHQLARAKAGPDPTMQKGSAEKRYGVSKGQFKKMRDSSQVEHLMDAGVPEHKLAKAMKELTSPSRPRKRRAS